jgi:hypothetical protein
MRSASSLPPDAESRQSRSNAGRASPTKPHGVRSAISANCYRRHWTVDWRSKTCDIAAPIVTLAALIYETLKPSRLRHIYYFSWQGSAENWRGRPWEGQLCFVKSWIKLRIRARDRTDREAGTSFPHGHPADLTAGRPYSPQSYTPLPRSLPGSES